MTTTKNALETLAKNLQLDAYSGFRYTEAAWLASCRMLAKRGYDLREIEAIMRSKWTRWAADSANTDQVKSAKPLTNFLNEILKRSGTEGLKREVAELVEQTF